MSLPDIQNKVSEETRPTSLLLAKNKPGDEVVCAMKDMLVRFPWKIVKSNKFEGRYFFYNTETSKSLWSFNELEASMFIVQRNLSNSIDQKEIKKIDDGVFGLKLPSTKTSTTSSFLGNNIISNCNTSISSSFSTDDGDNNDDDYEDWWNHRSSASTIDDEENRRSSSTSTNNNDNDNNNNNNDDNNTIIQQQSINYSILDGLGSGGFSFVLKVKEIYTNNIYAMKIINKKKQSMNQTIKELNSMLKTNTKKSPFLQQCYHAFENSKHVYIILDFHSGGDLFYHLNLKIKQTKKPFNEKEIQFIIAETILGLEHIHNNGMIHRDIKIENIMLDSKGHVKIIDFGLIVDIKEDKKNIKNLKHGSLIYMSPELIKNGIFGTFTDWWALGIVIFELITGNTPWSSHLSNHHHHHDKIVNDILNLKVTLPSNQNYSSSINRLVTALLRHDYNLRLGTTNGLSDFKSYSFFNSIDFDQLLNLSLQPVYIPGEIQLPRRESALIYTTYLEQMRLIDNEEEEDVNNVNNVKNKNKNKGASDEKKKKDHKNEDTEKNDGNWTLFLDNADQFLNIEFF